MTRAWVRGIPDCFDGAIVGSHGRRPNVAKAREQHADYVSRLEASGLDIIRVGVDEDHPDCVFIEDTAVLLGDHALICRPGAEPRRGEVDPVAEELSTYFSCTRVKTPGTLDGGDVMMINDVVYVGRSERTNQDGIDQLSAVARSQGMKTIAVDVIGVLHLKSAVLPIGGETVAVTKNMVDESKLEGLRLIRVAEDEGRAFSALPLSDRLLVTESAPHTGRRLEELGMDVDPIDVSEILAADGGLTCMSIVEY